MNCCDLYLSGDTKIFYVLVKEKYNLGLEILGSTNLLSGSRDPKILDLSSVLHFRGYRFRIGGRSRGGPLTNHLLTPVDESKLNKSLSFPFLLFYITHRRVT